jgi:hypothetical protein
MADVLILLVLVGAFAAMVGYAWACRDLTRVPEAEQKADE